MVRLFGPVRMASSWVFFACMLLVASIVTAVLPSNAAAQSLSTADQLIADGVVRADTGTAAPGTADQLAGLVPPGTIVVVTPGTDDTSLRPRIDGLTGQRQTLLVNYPESFGPVIAGRSGKFPLFAPSYDKSKEVAIQGNLKVMEAFKDDPNMEFAVYTGYSQGADALGDAVERAVAQGKIDPDKTLVIITSDPRGPWGLKQGLNQIPLLGPGIQTVLGAKPNGARNPADTGTVEVRQIIVTADPVGNWQWRWDRPLSSMVVNAAGFFACHSDPKCYGDLAQYGDPVTMKSAEGNTTYQVYVSKHPLTLMRQQLYGTLGIKYDAEDVAQWEKSAQAFYPISVPNVDNAAVPVEVVPTPPAEAVVDTPSTQDDTTPSVVDPVVDQNEDESTDTSVNVPTLPEPDAPLQDDAEPTPVDLSTTETTPSADQVAPSVSEPDTSSDTSDSSTAPDAELLPTS